MSDANEFAEAGARIRALRGSATQSAFADRLGVNRKTVERWESGERLPDGLSLLALMRSCGADVNFILTGKRDSSLVIPLTAEEQIVLRYYKEATPTVQKAAMAVLLSGSSSSPFSRQPPSLKVSSKRGHAAGRDLIIKQEEK